MYILHIHTIYIFLLTRLCKRGNYSLKADQGVKAVHWPQWSGSWWHLGGFNLTFHRCLWEFFVLIVFFYFYACVCFCFCLFKRTFVIGVRLLLWKTQKECMHNESKVSLYCYWILFDYLAKNIWKVKVVFA